MASCGDADEGTGPRDAGRRGERASDAGLDAAAARDGSDGKVAASQDAQVADEIVCSGQLPVMRARDSQTDTFHAPDWSCYQTAGDSGELEDAGQDREDLETVTVSLVPKLGRPLLTTDLAVDFFFGPSTLAAADVSRVFDTPDVQFDVPGDLSTFSARVNAVTADNPSLSIAEIYQFGLVPRADATNEVFVIIRDSRNLVISLARGGGTADADSALIISTARDCQGRDVSGARFELIDGQTGEPVRTGTDPGQPRDSYVQFALPTTHCTYTTADSPAWLMVDAPVNVRDGVKSRDYRLRVVGRMRERDVEPVVLGERAVEVYPGHVSYVRAYR